MTLSKSVGKVGEQATIVGAVNRRTKNSRMVYEPRTPEGKKLGVDAWFDAQHGYDDQKRFEEAGVRVGDIVSVTGTVYTYGAGKLGIRNVTSVVVVGKVPREELVAMFALVPATQAEDECAMCRKPVTAPKYVITPEGDVRTYDTVKCQKLAVARLYK